MESKKGLEMLSFLRGMFVLWLFWVGLACVIILLGGCTSQNVRGNPVCVNNCTATVGGAV